MGSEMIAATSHRRRKACMNRGRSTPVPAPSYGPNPAAGHWPAADRSVEAVAGISSNCTAFGPSVAALFSDIRISFRRSEKFQAIGIGARTTLGLFSQEDRAGLLGDHKKFRQQIKFQK